MSVLGIKAEMYNIQRCADSRQKLQSSASDVCISSAATAACINVRCSPTVSERSPTRDERA